MGGIQDVHLEPLEARGFSRRLRPVIIGDRQGQGEYEKTGRRDRKRTEEPRLETEGKGGRKTHLVRAPRARQGGRRRLLWLTDRLTPMPEDTTLSCLPPSLK